MQAEHGGNILMYENVLDFSANINPLGTPKEVIEAAQAAVMISGGYPDPFCRGLTDALAKRLEVPQENIVCGNGAADIIFRLVHALRPEKANLLAPTFSEYEAALRETGCEVSKVFLSEKNGFEVSDEICEQLADGGADMVFICSPNNPTGQLIGEKQLELLARLCRERGITLVSDESFMGLAGGGPSLAEHMSESTAVLCSMTKLYAVAGLRLGYAVFGSGELAEKVRRSGQFWSVSAPAQAAGEAALKLKGFEERTVKYIGREREKLCRALEMKGFMVVRTDANFLLFKAYEGFGKDMLDQGILIRECGNFEGLSNEYYRIAVRTSDENKQFIDTLFNMI